ncbi:hypothetical protein [Lysobacter panacisoli]|uniref:Uncharacterized protein n=1 Tax=Lysobacter panacisoli TaxID=1255263 RepID=A0ABP9KY78_9GAMM|nr:hypothetical protein [Lysobacter panacisoli]
MDIRTQTLPPGWRIEAAGPFPDTRRCVLRLIGPDGEDASWDVDEQAPQCDAVKRLAVALALTGESYRDDDDRPGQLLVP